MKNKDLSVPFIYNPAACTLVNALVVLLEYFVNVTVGKHFIRIYLLVFDL